MWRVEDDVQQMLRDSAVAWAEDAAGAERFRRFRASGQGFDPAQWTSMAELGWTGLLLPEAFGGSGLGLGPALTLAEIFGSHLVAAPFVASAVVAATLLAAGADEQRALDLAEGRAAPLAAIRDAATHGGVATTGVRHVDGKLHGTKPFVPGWHGGATLLVSALADGQAVVAVVEDSAEGMSVQSRKMADGSLAADVTFTAAPARVLLSGQVARDAIALARLREALAVCAMLEGLATRLFHMTSDYIKDRVQFDHPLASFQVLRHAMVDLHCQLELAGASWRLALRDLEANAPDAAKRVAAARARAASSAHAMAEAAIQYHGAFGYTEDADVGLYVNSILRVAALGGAARDHRKIALIQHRERAHAGV